MKDKVRKGFLIAVILLMCGYLLATGIYDLIDRNDLYTINADACVEILEIEHTVNGLIPIGKDHYYIAFDSQSGDACIVKASKRWYSKSFDETGYALAPGEITITALAKDIRDYEIEKELISETSQMEGVNFIVSPRYYLELSYKFNAICKLALIAVATVMAIFIKIWTKNPSGLYKKILIATALLFVVLLLKVVRIML